MKANELMIGDWVIGGSGEPFKIGIIDPDFLYWNEVQPIPITSEIFVKNGFIKQGVDGWEYIHPDDSTFSYISYRILYRTYYDNNLFIKKYKGSNTSATLQISYINFVHQLQHALKLCGIEKKIIL